MVVNYVDVKDVILKKFFIENKVTFPGISKEEVNVEDMNMKEEGETILMIEIEKEEEKDPEVDLEVEIEVINVLDLDQENVVMVVTIISVIDKIIKY